MDNKLIIGANTKNTSRVIKNSVKKKMTTDPTFLLMVQGVDNSSGEQDTARTEKKQSGKKTQTITKRSHRMHSVIQDQISEGITKDQSMNSQDHLKDSVLANLALAQSTSIQNKQLVSSQTSPSPKPQQQQDKNVERRELPAIKNVQRTRAPVLESSDRLTAGSTGHSLAGKNTGRIVGKNSDQPEKGSLLQESVIQQPVQKMTIKNTDEQFSDNRANSRNSVAALGVFLQTASDSTSFASSDFQSITESFAQAHDVNGHTEQDVGQQNIRAVLVSESSKMQNVSAEANLANDSLSLAANPDTTKSTIELLRSQTVNKADALIGIETTANVPEKAGRMPSNNDASGSLAFPLHTVAHQQMSALAMWRDFQTGSSPAPPVNDQVSSQMASWLGKATLNQNEDGVKSMTMTLYPENLGQVTITVQQDKDGIVALLTTSNKSAEDLLKNGLDQLQKDLVNQGLPVHQIDVTAKQETIAQNQQHTFQGQQQSRQGTDQGNHQNPRQREPQNLYQEDEDSEKHSFKDWIIEGSV